VTATCSTPGCPRPVHVKSTGECQACYKRRRYQEDPGIRKRAIAKSGRRKRRTRTRLQIELERLQAYEKGVEAWITSIETLGEDADRLYSADLRAAIEAHR
jgi:hypothetical protein